MAVRAGWAQRQTGQGLKYWASISQRWPMSRQWAATASSSTVSAGAPVTPAWASNSALRPA
ncbi:hypothetical protein D3C80_1932200 [compost metagenome]